jgi:Fe2+ or Zn2+ uptake regulation protein
MTLKTQVQCRQVGACLQVVADVKHISRLDQRASRSNLDSPHHDHFRCDQRGSATSAELTRTSKS